MENMTSYTSNTSSLKDNSKDNESYNKNLVSRDVKHEKNVNKIDFSKKVDSFFQDIMILFSSIVFQMDQVSPNCPGLVLNLFHI